MQTTIDIPEAQLEALHALSKARNQTPAEFIAELVSGVLAKTAPPKPGFEESFGLWKDRDIDGVEYQRQIRAEWDREWDR